MTRPAAAACALAIVCCVAPARAEKPPKPQRPYVSAFEGQGARLVVGRPAGKLLDVALPRKAGGGREILILVRPDPPKEASDPNNPSEPDCDQPPPKAVPDTTPRQLIKLDPAGGGAFATLQSDLPADAESLAAVDLDGDGADELLIGRKASVSVMTPAGMRPLVAQSDISLDGTLAAVATQVGGAGRLFVRSLRGLALFTQGMGSEAWASAGQATLPVEATIMGGELTVRGLQVQRAGGGAPGEPLLYAAGPREYGSQRLQTLVVHPQAAANEKDPLVTESWSLLPAPEEIVESSYMMLDGRVALLAITRPGEKLSILGEKLLRLFVLEPDRSRTGRPPLFACQSRMNLWQLAHPVLADANGDGSADIVIGYWKGLKDTTVVLDAYIRGADGKFATSPRSTEFDVDGGDRGMLEYGHDVTGDGLPDLIVRSVGTIKIHPGTASRDGKALVARTETHWVTDNGMTFSNDSDFDISFGPRQGTEGEGAKLKFRRNTAGDPRFVDLDGDGSLEMLVVRTGASDQCAVNVIRFAR